MSNKIGPDKLYKLGINPETLKIDDPEIRMYFWSCIEEFVRIVDLFYSPEAQEYFNNLIAAFMIDYNNINPNDMIKIYFRIKSLKSISDKIFEFFSRDEELGNGKKAKSGYVENSDNPKKPILLQDITDVFAMTIVYETGEEEYDVDNEEMQMLVSQKEDDDERIKLLKKFKSKCGRGTQHNYAVSRADYYLNCIYTILRIKERIDERATMLIKSYDQKLEAIKREVPEAFYNAVVNVVGEDNFRLDYMSLITKPEKLDISQEEQSRLEENYSEHDVDVVDFFVEYNAFYKRIPTQLDLCMLRNKAFSIFEESELLERLGISFSRDSLVKKRTPNGYVADFIILKTPFGNIEVQLQSEEEFKQGNYGYSAHSNIPGKKLELMPIPDSDDSKGKKEYREWAKWVTPYKGNAVPDNEGSSFGISIITDGRCISLQSTISQEKKGTPDAKHVKEYCKEMDRKRCDLWEGDSRQRRIVYDLESIREYIKTQKWKSFLNQKKQEFMEKSSKMEENVREMS